MKIVFTSAALIELTEAIDHLVAEAPELAHKLYEDVDALQRILRRYPLSFRARADGCRFAPLRRFEYVLVYRVADDEMTVFAFSHTSRRPGYWEDRLGGTGNTP